MNRPLLAALALVLLSTGAGVSGCAAEAPGRPVAASGVPPQTTSATTTDLAWAQLTAALDENVLRVLDLAAERGHPRAGETARRRTAELPRLRTVLRALGAPSANPHDRHEMPGMATAAQLSELAKATGASFDRQLTLILRAHAEQCLRLAEAQARAGVDPATLALAADVASTRRADLALL
ncbi:MAG: DUF305 domain-containing protein [Hamadaea sp.]|nr:DUF305 domain-containing protein [Hamadaea sp.]